jgi:hypothetical protein
MVKAKEVTINRMAAAAVNLARKGVAPELPKTVWLDPPKAAPIPAPRPVCNNTMKIRARQTIICTTIINVIIKNIYNLQN